MPFGLCFPCGFPCVLCFAFLLWCCALVLCFGSFPVCFASVLSLWLSTRYRCTALLWFCRYIDHLHQHQRKEQRQMHHMRPRASTCSTRQRLPTHPRTRPTRTHTRPHPCPPAHARVAHAPAYAPAHGCAPTRPRAPLRGSSACARSDCPLRVSNPNLTLGISHTIYSGINARIAALSRLHRARASSCSSTTVTRSPLLRIRVRSARTQSWRSWVGNPMY